MALRGVARGIARAGTGALDLLVDARLAANRTDAFKAIVQGLGVAAAAYEFYSFYQNKVEATNPIADVVFPIDLLRINDVSKDLFFIKFTFQKYEKRSQYKSSVVKATGPGIKLPIPKSLRDNLSVSYDYPSLDSKAGIALELLTGGAKPDDDTSALKQAFNATKGYLEASGVEALKNQPQTAGAAQVLQAFSGIAPNPYQTWLFKAPNFRTHNFSWTLSPESPEESNIIRQIIHLFQKNLLPSIQKGNAALLLQYPSIVNIQLFAGNPQNSNYLYDFKPCVLKSVSVDYAASGKPAFFTSGNYLGTSGAPAAINLTVDLQEIEFWTSDNIT